jgi:hypothetical protein
MRRALGLLSFVLLLAPACKSKDNTKIVVAVWSDLVVPTALDEIRIAVAGNSATSDSFLLAANGQVGKTALPVELELVTSGPKDASVTVTAIGLHGKNIVVSQEARVFFVPGQALLLKLFLSQACENVPCPADHTCAGGKCDQPIAVPKLPLYDPNTPLTPPIDTGGTGGSDAAVAPQPGAICTTNADCVQGLTCSFGVCLSVCPATVSCPSGEQCVKNSSGINVCLLPTLEACGNGSPCQAPLACAADQKCRNQCRFNSDCATANQDCVLPDGVCAEHGVVIPSRPADAGTADASVVKSDVSAPDAIAPKTDGPISDASGPDVPMPTGADSGSSLSDTLAGKDGPIVALDTGPVCSTSCDDGLSCTADSCVSGTCRNTLSLGYCLIDSACYTDGQANPSDQCKACVLSASTSAWTQKAEGASRGIGKTCQSDACKPCGTIGQSCCGTTKPGTCSVGAMCNGKTNQCEADKAIDLAGNGGAFCALFRSGQVRCWGSDSAMTGTSSASTEVGPPITGLNDAVDLSVGNRAACAVRANGGVVCWGSALPGGGSSSTAVPISGIANAKQVSVDITACARISDGTVFCWGDDSRGQFGTGAVSQTASATPAQMRNVTDATKIISCDRAVCVLRRGGQVSCAGSGSEIGQKSDMATLTDIPGLSGIVGLSCSTYWSNGTICAFSELGALICFSYGTASAIPGMGQVAQGVSNGSTGSDSIAVLQDQTVLSYGYNRGWQFGDGSSPTTNSLLQPYHGIARLFPGTKNVSGAVSASLATVSNGVIACVLLEDGSVNCAGGSSNGGFVLGDGQHNFAVRRATFVPVVGILPVSSEAGQCFDGVDNDGNGRTDLDDLACAQDLGSKVGSSIATGPFTGIYGNYLQESCNSTGTSSSSHYGGPDAVFTWTAPGAGTYQFDTNGSSFDTVLAIFKGNPTTEPELACNDTGVGVTNGASAIQLPVSAGDKLTLVIDSKSEPAPPSTFTLNITKQ